MFPFWDVAIAPVFDATRARRVVEIGALRGDTTIRMLERLGPEAELHVIDPKPEFDPTEHEDEFPGRYIFHRDLSLNVLSELPPVDVALIDGDHNWYTVINEMRDLARVARDAAQAMPVMILHDVGWPYGRRDLYYDPATIPEEFRQPYAQLGIRMGRSEVLPSGGLNPTMNNALVEGGPRNGVMTGVDDFIEEYDKPLRLVVLPAYFGLALVAEEERLADQPELGDLFDRLEGGTHQQELLYMAEGTRLKAMLFQHNVFYHREQLLDRAATRYLDLLKGSLLGEHYVENEVRIGHLLDCVERGSEPVENMLRDPVRWQKDKTRRLLAARQVGRLDDSDDLMWYFPYTTMGRRRLDHLEGCLLQIREESLEGDLVDCGTGRGGSGIFMRAFLDTYGLPRIKVWVADPFRSTSDTVGVDGELGGGPGLPRLQADLNTVRDAFERFGYLDDRVRFVQGPLEESLPDAPVEKIALLRIGSGIAGEVRTVLDDLYERVTVGGYVLVEEHAAPAVAAAVAGFRADYGIEDEVDRVDWTGIAWRKTEQFDRQALARRRPSADVERRPRRPPLVSEAPRKTVDLSVVVVFYNMRREAERTLHSLSRAYQQGIDDLDYEVIVVDNGSDEDQRLTGRFVRSFGPEFRLVDMGEEAPGTPVIGLNQAIASARGEAFALMIDGAHVLTPGVMRFAMAGLEMYEPTIVMTQQWYVGPGQQGEAMMEGYDQSAEDRLFEAVGWPTDGYRLFDIGHFIGERDWLDGMWESNCLFVRRELLEQVGAFDEGFQVAGGGYANLELYERLGSTPGVTVTTILGEGSFHQVHGGTTTNQPSIEERKRRLASYSAEYTATRGRSYRGPEKRVHYVGTMFWEACRTRARRRIAPVFFEAGEVDAGDGMPEEPTPIPQDLQTEFTDAFWRSLRWKTTKWLGRNVPKPPSDLILYQELIHQVRPDWIVETARQPTARSLFLASICDLVGHGNVLSIDAKRPENRIEHPRISYLQGDPWEPDVAAAIRELTGTEPNALVIVGSRGRRLRTLKEFEAFRDLVPVGSYVIVEDTIVNGHPVWPGFGLGPAEAVRQILAENADFAADTSVEKYAMTFNPGGFLKRVT